MFEDRVDAGQKLAEEYADQIVIINKVLSDAFGAVGSFYKVFGQTEYSEVQDIMAQAHES